jgi:hypothetical protein
MPDLHDELDRLSRRVEAPPTIDDLRTRRERAQRRSARQALAAGLCIAVLGSVIAFTALRPGVPTPVRSTPGWTAPDPVVVWPESPTSGETAEQAQSRVDAGGDLWRLDPEQVVDRFARVVLGWGDPSVVRVGEDAYTLTHQEVSPPLEVLVAQPARQGDGGIWSVAQVSHPDLSIEVAADSAAFDLTVSSDRSAHVGLVATNGCRDATSFELALGSGPFRLSFPDPTADDPACSDVGAGYVFAYVTDDTTVPVGDPLFEAAAIEYPWLTIVPVQPTMEGTSAP